LLADKTIPCPHKVSSQSGDECPTLTNIGTSLHTPANTGGDCLSMSRLDNMERDLPNFADKRQSWTECAKPEGQGVTARAETSDDLDRNNRHGLSGKKCSVRATF
jgi:hypothetical protein